MDIDLLLTFLAGQAKSLTLIPANDTRIVHGCEMKCRGYCEDSLEKLCTNAATATCVAYEDVFEAVAADDCGGQQSPLTPQSEARIFAALFPGGSEEFVFVQIEGFLEELFDGGIIRLFENIEVHRHFYNSLRK